MPQRVFILAVLVAVVSVLAVSSGWAQAPAETPPPPAPPPIATVNGEALTADDWVSTAKAFFGAEALRRLIEERLLIQEAHRLGLSVTAADIDRRITQIKAEYPREKAFQAMLQGRGISLNTLRREIKRELVLEKIVDKLANITDEDVAQYYEAHIAEFSKPTKVCLYAITTNDQRTAAVAVERLANEDFGAVAADLSVDEHAADGGFWGCLAAEEIEPEALRIAAFALEPGARSEPIEVEGKYYVLWAKERQPGSTVALAEARAEIKKRLRAEKGLTPEAVLKGIIRRAKISIQEPTLAFLSQEYEKVKQIQVVVDGTPLELDKPPVILKSGRMVVPAKPLLEAVGASVEWFPSTQTMRVRKADTEILIALETTIAIVNGEQATIDQPPVKRDGALFVAPRWIVEQLGGSVLWSPAEYTLKVKSVKAAAPEEG